MANSSGTFGIQPSARYLRRYRFGLEKQSGSYVRGLWVLNAYLGFRSVILEEAEQFIGDVLEVLVGHIFIIPKCEL